MGISEDGRSWSDKGWTARIVLNEDGGGWALSMTQDGNDEPILIVPWVMGRNKKDPKPLNKADFASQLKAARDFVARHKQQLSAAHRVTRNVSDAAGPIRVVFDLIPDEFEPEGELVAWRGQEEVARVRCAAGFKLSQAEAQSWVDEEYGPVSGGAEW
jgi:hypothetical protein